MLSPIAWLATRTPPAPDELKAWWRFSEDQTDHDGGVASVAGFLVARGLAHLDEAVATPGRDREAAYRLLAADALITYGCEAASEETDVRGTLREVLLRVSGGGAVA